jgi:hypothetical protein
LQKKIETRRRQNERSANDGLSSQLVGQISAEHPAYRASGEYLRNAFHQREPIHRIKNLLIDDVPIGSYPAGIAQFNAANRRAIPWHQLMQVNN